MNKNKPSRYEQETVITFNNESKIATVYTHNSRLIKNIGDNCNKYPDLFKLISEDEFSKIFEVPKRLVSIKKPRILSEKQREDLRNRFGRKQISSE